MTQPITDPPTTAGAAETVFRAKSLWYLSLTLMVGAVAALGCSLELGFGDHLRSFFNLTPAIAKEVSWVVGGVAVLIFAAVAWEWYRDLRWVAVSADGLRWYRGGRVHDRGWSEFARIQRIVVKSYLNGQHNNTARGAEVKFHHGPPLLVSPTNAQEYETLISEIESKTRGRNDNTAGRNKSSDQQDEGRSFGPLHLDPCGVEWEGLYFTWEHVRSYQVEQGYLLIQTNDGTEFLRRLADLGEWQPALDRLELALPDKRVGSVMTEC